MKAVKWKLIYAGVIGMQVGSFFSQVMNHNWLFALINLFVAAILLWQRLTYNLFKE